MNAFIDNYLAHIIATVALLQIWVIAAWKRWIIKGELQFHPSANIEIGFSAFGSTVSLPGTVRALHKDVFVAAMRVTITRLSDNATHNFTWRAFKSNIFSVPTLTPQGIEIATSFNLPLSAPRAIYVFFASADFASRYAQQAEALRKAWSAFAQKKLYELGTQIATLAQMPGFADNLFTEFLSDPVTVNLYAQLNNGFYWQVGTYKLDLHIQSAAPTEPTTDSWKFDITAEEEQKLRLNSITTLKELCGLQTQYNFIYKPYDAVTQQVHPGRRADARA